MSRLEGRAAILQLRYDPLIKFLILKVWKNLIVQEKYNLDQIWSIDEGQLVNQNFGRKKFFLNYFEDCISKT